MRSLSNYFSAVILLLVTIASVGFFIDVINNANSALIRSVRHNHECISTINYNGTKLVLIDKGFDPFVIGNYTVLVNTTKVLFLQANGTVEILCGGEYYEVK